jgi:hypothetical protein
MFDEGEDSLFKRVDLSALPTAGCAGPAEGLVLKVVTHTAMFLSLVVVPVTGTS